jgi:hypothetical protein
MTLTRALFGVMLVSCSFNVLQRFRSFRVAHSIDFLELMARRNGFTKAISF